MENSLSSLYPNLVLEWSQRNLPLTPDMISYGSNKKVWWRCKYGHEWTATIKNRTLSGSGCPYCSHNRILEGFNDLASQRPDLAKEWSDRNYPLLPNQVTSVVNRKVWWKCSKCGNEWETLISTRSGGSKCPYCSGLTLLKGFNDLATRYPQLAKEWSDKNGDLKSDMVNERSRKNVWWKCHVCGYEWKSVIYTRVNGGRCPVCSNRAVLSGYNDLATTDPELLAEWDFEKNTDISPDKISRHSMRVVWWKCPLGHSWREKISERVFNGKSCKVCEGDYKSVLPKLAVMFYAKLKNMSAITDSDKLIGIPLETYVPEERLVIESYSKTQDIEDLKSYLCKKRNIKLIKISNKGDEINVLDQIKKAFRRVHVFINSNTERDAKIIKESFYEWRLRQI